MRKLFYVGILGFASMLISCGSSPIATIPVEDAAFISGLSENTQMTSDVVSLSAEPTLSLTCPPHQVQLSKSEFIDLMYRGFLNREPDPSGFQNWQGYNGSFPDIAFRFAQSDEAIIRINGGSPQRPDLINQYRRNEYLLVDRFYVGLLDRSPDPVGKDYWVNMLSNNPSSNFSSGFREDRAIEVAQGFISSQEFCLRVFRLNRS